MVSGSGKFSALLSILLFAFTLSAQNLPQPTARIAGERLAHSTAQQEVVAPYWTSEPGWETELQLKNNLSNGPLTVTPVLRLSSGQEIPLDPVTIDPNDSASVWVNEGLLKHSAGLFNQPGSFGSIVLRFTSFNARNLHAAVVLSLHGEPIAFQLTGHPSPKSETWPRAAFGGSQEGIWWRPRPFANDFLVVSNSSDNSLSGTLRLSNATGKRWSQRLNLKGRETKRVNVAELLQTAGLTGEYGGIQIEVGSSAGSLDSVRFMYDETTKSSMLLRMVSRDPMTTQHERVGPSGRQWALWAPMLAMRVPDPVLSLPAKTLLQPTIFLRNVTGNTVPARIGLSWGTDAGNGQVELPKLELKPFATQQLKIGDMQKQLGGAFLTMCTGPRLS